MSCPILYSFIRCPYAMRARMAIKLCDIKCEIREVRLNNKPDQMIKQSPKGTVPVLVLKNKVIDESNEIIDWALSKNNVFEVNLDQLNIYITNDLIKLFDSKFKGCVPKSQPGGVSKVYTQPYKKHTLTCQHSSAYPNPP